MVDDYVPEESMSNGMEMITGVTPDIVTHEQVLNVAHALYAEK